MNIKHATLSREHHAQWSSSGRKVLTLSTQVATSMSFLLMSEVSISVSIEALPGRRGVVISSVFDPSSHACCPVHSNLSEAVSPTKGAPQTIQNLGFIRPPKKHSMALGVLYVSLFHGTPGPDPVSPNPKPGPCSVLRARHRGTVQLSKIRAIRISVVTLRTTSSMGWALRLGGRWADRSHQRPAVLCFFFSEGVRVKKDQASECVEESL